LGGASDGKIGTVRAAVVKQKIFRGGAVALIIAGGHA
jgi:hypothetical protein